MLELLSQLKTYQSQPLSRDSAGTLVVAASCTPPWSRRCPQTPGNCPPLCFVSPPQCSPFFQGLPQFQYDKCRGSFCSASLCWKFVAKTMRTVNKVLFQNIYLVSIAWHSFRLIVLIWLDGGCLYLLYVLRLWWNKFQRRTAFKSYRISDLSCWWMWEIVI